MSKSAWGGSSRSAAPEPMRRPLIRERRDRWLVGTVDEVVEQIEGLRALGVSRVLLQHLNHGDDDMLALAGELLLPRLV